MPTPLFRDRLAAGKQLAARLRDYRDHRDLLVLALPRGGIPVGFVVAKELGAPLDVFVVRKLGVPGDEEHAMGAVASGGVLLLASDFIAELGLSQQAVAQVVAAERRELARREADYRRYRRALSVRRRTIIVIDDGMATGFTVLAAVAALRRLQPARIVVGVPIAARESCASVAAAADELVCLQTPKPFGFVGYWYRSFLHVSDEQSQTLLRAGRCRSRSPRVRPSCEP